MLKIGAARTSPETAPNLTGSPGSYCYSWLTLQAVGLDVLAPIEYNRLSGGSYSLPRFTPYTFEDTGYGYACRDR